MKKKQDKRFCSLILVIGCLLLSETANANDDNSSFSSLQTFSDLLLPEVSQVTIGAGVDFSPDYFGSDDYKIGPKIDFYARIDNYLFFGTDGASLNIIGSNKFQLGPVASITGKRAEKANQALEGLGDIKRSIDVGLYAKYVLTDRLSVKARLFSDLVGGDNGPLVDLSLNAMIYNKDDWSVAVGATGTWIGKKRALRFFGINAEQAQNSQFSEYFPGTTVSDVRFDAATRWQFSEKWALNWYAQYSRLLGNVSRSPLVAEFGTPDQFTFGTYITYTFEWN